VQHEHPEQKKSMSPKRPQAQREAQAYAGQDVVRKMGTLRNRCHIRGLTYSRYLRIKPIAIFDMVF